MAWGINIYLFSPWNVRVCECVQLVHPQSHLLRDTLMSISEHCVTVRSVHIWLGGFTCNGALWRTHLHKWRMFFLLKKFCNKYTCVDGWVCMLVERSPVGCRVSWVRIPPRAALLLFFERKELSWVQLTCLPCLSTSLPSC